MLAQPGVHGVDVAEVSCPLHEAVNPDPKHTPPPVR
jgi:hypothetical protein